MESLVQTNLGVKCFSSRWSCSSVQSGSPSRLLAAAPLRAAPVASSPAHVDEEQYKAEPEIQVSRAALRPVSCIRARALSNAAKLCDALLSPWPGKAAYPLQHPVVVRALSSRARSEGGRCCPIALLLLAAVSADFLAWEREAQS